MRQVCDAITLCSANRCHMCGTHQTQLHAKHQTDKAGCLAWHHPWMQQRLQYKNTHNPLQQPAAPATKLAGLKDHDLSLAPCMNRKGNLSNIATLTIRKNHRH